MPVKSGIIGLPNVGKTLLFNALSHSAAPSENFPFCTIEPNISIINIPDPRLQQLASLIKPQKITPTTLNFVDIAGIVKGANKGEGLGNKFLANIREVDAIIHVIRCFENPDIIHVAGQVDPVFDKTIIEEELRLKDLTTLTQRKEKLSKIRTKEIAPEKQLLQTYINALEHGKNARSLPTNPQTLPIVKNWQLLTQKPVIYVANIDETSLKQGTNPHLQKLKQAVATEGALLLTLSVALEATLSTASDLEKQTLLKTYNLPSPGLDRLIQTAYQLLNLITYFTAGPQEVRAWTIPQNTPAPQAAGAIHTDFQKGFIRAQVTKLTDYLHHKTEKACKQAGKINLQGKKYIVQDGDIIHFICKT